MKIKVTRKTDEEIIGTLTTTREIRAPINNLKNYLIRNGFKQDGEWYFRGTWMKDEELGLYEVAGLVKKLGLISSLKENGISFPDNPKYKFDASLIYKVTDGEINKL